MAIIMEIKRYTRDMAPLWDGLVDEARQRSFLFKRQYMDYHSDRFEDFSLVAYDKGKPVALLPANRCGDVAYSHQGLTYGGWLTAVKGFDALSMLDLWGEMTRFMQDAGVRKMLYKRVPWIYSSIPAEEDSYALFRAQARVVACQVSSAIDLSAPVGFNKNARRNLAKAVGQGIKVGESFDFACFWRILTSLLEERYGVSPVHSLGEMEMLAGRFPENIRLFTATDSGEMLAGVVMYFTGTVAHAQYIGASQRGKSCGALPLLFDYILGLCGGCRYFDFGTSCERGGWYLNDGLLRQKSGFGGRAVTYDTYEVDFSVNEA